VQVRNEKARRFLMNMRHKPGVKFEQYFHKADRGALRLLKLMLSFDPAERPTSDEVPPPPPPKCAPIGTFSVTCLVPPPQGSCTVIGLDRV